MRKTTHGSLVKLLSLLLAAVLLTSLLPGEILAAGANSLTESLNRDSWLENNAIHVDVSKQTGAFYIRTVAGDKLVKGDENANLLWPGEDDTSFTTVRITRGGVTKDYIFGKSYDEGGNPVAVTNDGTRITAVWTVDSVTVTQNIELQPTGNDAHGMVAISYTAENLGGDDASVAIRVLLDTAMGGKDYAYYNVGDPTGPVSYERALGEDGYDKSIYMMDDPADPLVTGYILNGSLDGVEQKPVRTVLAHWASLASTVYDYAPDPTLNFTNAFNARHLTSDSAVALYYSLGRLSPNASAATMLNYGLYSNERVEGYQVAVNLQTIDQLGFADESEQAFADGGRFTARTILQNASQTTYGRVRIYAYASGGISVLNSDGSATDGQGRTYGYDNPYYVELNDFAPGQKANNLGEWKFQAAMAAEANYGRIHFKVYDMTNSMDGRPVENDLIGEARKYILVPGSEEKLPNIQLTGSSPNIFHTEGHRIFNVTGMKFAGLEAEANDAYTLKLSRKDGAPIRGTETVLSLPTAAFAINEDGSGLMSVTIDGNLPAGEYKVTVDYTQETREDLNAKALEFQVVDDARYRCETYGFVAVYREDNDNGSRQSYKVGTFPSESEYEGWLRRSGTPEENVLMLFRGVFDNLTNSLPEGAQGELSDGEEFGAYLVASLPEGTSVTMSDALEFSHYESGSNVTIKQITEDDGGWEKSSVKVDLNCRVTTAGVGSRVFSGVCCFTELKADNRYSLIEYDDAGERDDMMDKSIALLWPRAGVVAQYLMGVMFDFRYAELGAMFDETGKLATRTVGFGAGLDLSCIIPGADELEGFSGSEETQMSPEEIRSWNEAYDIREQSKSFSEKNKDRADANLSNGFYDDDDGGMSFSGSVQVSDILFGAHSFIGFNFCVGVGIPPLVYGMPSLEGVFTLRTIGQVEFRVNGQMDFTTVQLEGLLDLKANDLGILIPDELKFFIGGFVPGQPLDPWGVLWLQGGGGGIKDLYDTIYLQDKVPPIKLILQAQFSVLQLMVAKGTVELGLTGFGIALSDVRIQATSIPILDSAVFALRWYPNFALISSVQVDLLDMIEGGGYIVGYVNYDGSNPFFEFFLRAALSLPEDIPIVGGMTLGAVSMGVSTERIFGKAEALGIGIGFSYYWSGEFDWGSKNEANPTFPELLGLGQEFDTDIDEMFENIPAGKEDEDGDGLMSLSNRALEAVPVYYDRENHRTLMAVPGTNLDAGNTAILMADDDPAGPADSQQNVLRLGPDGKSIQVTLGSNGKSKILLLSWESADAETALAEANSINTGDYALTFLDHDRDAAEQPTANANLSFSKAEGAETGKASLAITVTDSSVTSLKISSDLALEAVIYDVDPLPGLSSCTAALEDSTLTVSLDGTSLDSFDFVNVCLVEQSQLEAEAAGGSVSELTLLGRIEKDGEGHLPTSFTAELPADLPSGEYAVRLMAQDEAHTLASQIDQSDYIDFVNPYTPAAPEDVGDITGAGDWKVNIPITAGQGDFDGYALTVTDMQGESVSGLTDLLFFRNGEMALAGADGLLTVPAENPDKGMLTVGGRFEAPVPDVPESGSVTANEETLTKTAVLGFSEGRYTASIRKWKAVNGVPVYSDAVLKEFTVSAPAPADVTITGGSTVTRAEPRGEETVSIPYYTGGQLRLTLSADKAVTGAWVVDGQGRKGNLENKTSATIDLTGLDDGVHVISFTGVTEAGDTSGASCVFGVDSKAPTVLVSAPENGGSFDAATGRVTFTGVTDPDAQISFYDVTTGARLTPSVSIEPATGEFSAVVTLDKAVSSHQVTLIAEDDLGNRAERSFALSNSRLASITSVRMFDENGRDQTEKKLSTGDHTLRLVGVTQADEIVELTDPSLIEWDVQTLEGPALKASRSEDGTQLAVTVTAGTVGVITGQLLVNDAGSYPVSSMVGSTLSVNAEKLTVAAGESVPLGVSSSTGDELTYSSADETIATVHTDSDGHAVVTGVKAGITTVTVTASGETATVQVVVNEPGKEPVLLSPIPQDTNGGAVAVDLTVSPDGVLFKGDEVTLTAKAVPGYSFLGWYQSGEQVCSALVYSFTITADTDLVALYQANGSASVTINGDGRPFTINGSAQNSEVVDSYRLGSGITVTTAGENFAYWANAYGNILSRNPTYTFTVTGAQTVKAIFNSMIDGKASLIFESPYEQVMARRQLAEGETMEIPSIPFWNGYTALGWDFDGDGDYDAGTDTLEAAIQRGLSAADRVVTIRPVYVLRSDTYTVTVIGGTADKESYRQNDLVTVTAAAPAAGKKFSHWTDGSAILGYSPVYTFFAEKNVELTAVFVDDAEVVEAVGTTSIVNMSSDPANKKLTFVSMSTVPEGCTIVKAGVIATDDAAVANSGDGFNDTTAKFAVGNPWTGNSYRYSFTKGKVEAGTVWYVRAYLVYTDVSGEMQTVYGDLVSNSYT